MGGSPRSNLSPCVNKIGLGASPPAPLVLKNIDASYRELTKQHLRLQPAVRSAWMATGEQRSGMTMRRAETKSKRQSRWKRNAAHNMARVALNPTRSAVGFLGNLLARTVDYQEQGRYYEHYPRWIMTASQRNIGWRRCGIWRGRR